MGNIQRADYNAKEDINTHNPGWMAQVPDSKPVTQMTIPGTHNTCAPYGGDAIACQSLSLPKQLDAGIRFIDIRCRHFNDTLPIHHGLKFQHKNFSSVLSDVVSFLQEHPTEGVLMSVMPEYKPSGNTIEFGQLVYNTCCNVNEDKFVHCEFPEDASKLTMGQLRGKICVMRQYDGRCPPGNGLLWGRKSKSFCEQDDYSIPTLFHLDSKKKKIVDHLRAANQDPSKLYVNFCSGVGGGCLPYTCARDTNEAAMDFIQSWLRGMTPTSCREGFGIVVADFPGNELIEACINANNM